MKMTDLRFWHYTKSFYLPKIIESGRINLSTAGIGKKEKPVVWLTTSSEWENTSTVGTLKDGVMKFLSKEEMCIQYGMGRIEIKPSSSFVTFKKFGTTSGVDPRIFISLYNTGIENGSNPDDWYASYIPILSRYFLSVEMYIEEKWIKCEDLKEITQFVEEGMKRNKLFYQ